MPEGSERLRAALYARLERVRGAMSDADFAQLIDDVMETTRRFEEIDAREKGANPLHGLRTVRGPEAHWPG